MGCGACCKGRFLPLTFSEALKWLNRGHPVVVMLEGFNQGNWPADSAHFDHHKHRSELVKSGKGTAQAIAIFAANNLTACPNLADDNSCGIYEERPLVCRIYPREINPFIFMSPREKECPPHSWIQAHSTDLDDIDAHAFSPLIQASRDADRADARMKLSACEMLELTVAGWKGDGLTLYEPEPQALQAAMLASLAGHRPQLQADWTFSLSDDSLREKLSSEGLEIIGKNSQVPLIPLSSKH